MQIKFFSISLILATFGAARANTLELDCDSVDTSKVPYVETTIELGTGIFHQNKFDKPEGALLNSADYFYLGGFVSDPDVSFRYNLYLKKPGDAEPLAGTLVGKAEDESVYSATLTLNGETSALECGLNPIEPHL